MDKLTDSKPDMELYVWRRVGWLGAVEGAKQMQETQGKA